MRPEPQADVGAVVAEDAAPGELLVDALEVRRAHDDGAAAPGRVVRAADLEAGLGEKLDE